MHPSHSRNGQPGEPRIRTVWRVQLLKFAFKPPAFRDKWSTLADQRCVLRNRLPPNSHFSCSDFTGQSFAQVLGGADGGGLVEDSNYGRRLTFANGVLTAHNDSIMTIPFLVCGKIYHFWYSLGGLQSGFGHPIADPQALPDGSMCSIFQGGHIHQQSPSKEPEVLVIFILLSHPPGLFRRGHCRFPANQCRAAYQPPEPPSMPSPTWVSAPFRGSSTLTNTISLSPGLFVRNGRGFLRNGMLIFISHNPCS